MPAAQFHSPARCAGFTAVRFSIGIDECRGIRIAALRSGVDPTGETSLRLTFRSIAIRNPALLLL